VSTPTPEQLHEVFAALVGNGLDFFLRSAHELDQEQKFAIAHFATGVELLLKGRLFHEHWTLIATTPHECAWTSVKDGTVRTLQASDLCAVITTTTGTPLNHQKTAFEAVFNHRNRVLHWAPTGDLGATVAEQCLAWYHLRALLVGPWTRTFAAFAKRIEEVEQQLRAHRSYLEVRYEQIENTLKGLAKARCLLQCPACDFNAGAVDDDKQRVQAFECRVCGYTAHAARVSCGALLPLDSLPVDDCECGADHDREQLLDDLDPTPLLSPKEMSTYEANRGHCGECLEVEATVAPDGEGYACVSCGARFEGGDAAQCECCNEQWFGWDSEGSYLLGCEHCDGTGDADDD
jgi:hypothetical protein